MNNTDFILFYERFAKEKLARYFGVEDRCIEHISAINPSAPHDLECSGKTVNVKMSNPTHSNLKSKVKIWDFDLRKNGSSHGKNFKAKTNSICDLWLLIGFTKAVPQNIYLVENKEVSTRHIRIPLSGNSKYTKYLIWVNK